MEVVKRKISDRLKKAMVPVLSLMALLMPASAQTVNWSTITETITGVTSIFPSFIDLVSAAVPVFITFAVIGFVLGFFDSILDMIRGLVRFR